jgi:hypothetical protein
MQDNDNGTIDDDDTSESSEKPLMSEISYQEEFVISGLGIERKVPFSIQSDCFENNIAKKRKSWLSSFPKSVSRK